jgi:formate hydrogenlyase subunit 3/multisubunit Na+/H+ antiporter MnhD subunit
MNKNDTTASINILHFITSVSLFLPLFIGYDMGKDYMGKEFPLFVGLSLQALIGNLIFIYARGYEQRKLSKIFLGYLIFFLGLSGSYLAGKSFWLLFFWEISTVGAILIYLGGPFTTKGIRSIVALFLASSISMVFLCVWIFLPDNDSVGFNFLLVGLLIKSAFSGLHYWLPEAHSGPPSHGSAAYSGLMINLPLLLFVYYSPTNFGSFPFIQYLILLAGLGVFLGGLASFFHKDIKKSLAYSTIENSNFLWLTLLLSKLWFHDTDVFIAQLGSSFLVLFYITLLHHSISKVYQFLSFGYLAKIAGTTLTDSCKGIGRIAGLPFLAVTMGTLSFAMVPGTIGFFSESTFLYLCSILIDLPVSQSALILPSLVFISTGLALGGASHCKLYLTLVLSVPTSPINEINVPKNSLKLSLQIMGWLIILIPLFLWIPFAFYQPFIQSIPTFFTTWIIKISAISIFMVLVSIFVIRSRFWHTIKKREIWDCGSKYRGSDVSIPGSVISDPLYPSLGRYILTPDGESKIDTWFFKTIDRVLSLGRYWIKVFETGDLTTYLFLSAVALLVSISIVLLYHSWVLK